jgi:hypothetical protein
VSGSVEGENVGVKKVMLSALSVQCRMLIELYGVFSYLVVMALSFKNLC